MKVDNMYFLVMANPLDDAVLRLYAESLPHSRKLHHSRNSAVFCIEPVERGQRTAAFKLSQAHQYSHMFFNAQSKGFPDYKLLVSDMDSTLIAIECIDVLAHYHGCADAVSRLTAQAMADKNVDYRASLEKRVALLKGFSASMLPAIYERHVKLTPGAQRLLTLARHAGMYTTIASGGFTYFTKRLSGQLGMSGHVGNTLEVIDGVLTGRLLGDFVDARFKAHTLRRLCLERGLSAEDAIAIGDGANDLLMMEAAGLAVGYQPKQVIGEYADVVVFGDLDLLPRMLSIGNEVVQDY